MYGAVVFYVTNVAGDLTLEALQCHQLLLHLLNALHFMDFSEDCHHLLSHQLPFILKKYYYCGHALFLPSVL